MEGDILGKNIRLINTPLKKVKFDKSHGLIIDK